MTSLVKTILSVFAVSLLITTLSACKSSSVKHQPAAPARNELSPPSDSATANYDKALIKAIQVRWMQLLDQRGYAGGGKGRMVVEFKLHSNGSVSDIKVVESNIVPSLSMLCERAIKEVTPFAPWPEPMRREISKDERAVRFNFSF